MSTAVAPALSRERTVRRSVPRYQVAIPVDVTVLRSGIPDSVPGRALDVGDGGLGAVLAGEVFPNEPVGVEFQLPYVGVPVRTRAVVRYQDRLRCGLQFLGLTVEQQGMIRYYARCTGEPRPEMKIGEPPRESADLGQREVATDPLRVGEDFHQQPRSLQVQRLFATILAALAVAAALGWWHWQRGWKELESKLPNRADISDYVPIKVPAKMMEQRIRHKVEPTYPEAARQAKVQGVVVLDVVIGRDGTVMGMRRVSGPEELAQPAIDAVRWWRFEPYPVNGQPTEVETALAVEF